VNGEAEPRLISGGRAAADGVEFHDGLDFQDGISHPAAEPQQAGVCPIDLLIPHLALVFERQWH